MKEDLAWLKEQMNRPIASSEEMEKGYYLAVDKFNELINQVEQPEQPVLPVIPDWFAEWCKSRVWGDLIHKGEHYTRKDLSDLLEIANGGNLHGLTEKQGKEIDMNFFKYLNALQNGYTVEEKKYVVKLRGLTKAGESIYLLKENGAGIDWSSEKYVNKHLSFYAFTEKEIKKIDEGYWAFAVPVEEVNE